MGDRRAGGHDAGSAALPHPRDEQINAVPGPTSIS